TANCGRVNSQAQETKLMNQRFSSIQTIRCHMGCFMAIFFMAAFGMMPNLSSQAAAPGALELTSGLGRKLYALPDDKGVSDARASLAADPKNVCLVLQLAHRQAVRRPY